MKILFVINPISGDRDKAWFLKYLSTTCNKFGIESYILKTTGDREQDEGSMKQAVNEFKPERVCAVGGDGTTLFAARHIMGTEICLGIVPFGSANGMAVELNINPDPEEALNDFLKSRWIEKLDLIKVNDRHYCLHIGDVGLNARVVENFSKDMNRGMLTYAKYFIAELQNAEMIDFEVDADGQHYEHTGYMLAIANARKYGTGALVNKGGSPFDGKFEVVIGKRKDLESIIFIGLTKFSEEINIDEYLQKISCKTAHIKLKKPYTLQLDGEIVGKVTEIKAEIMPGVVNLITHGENEFI